MAYSRKNDDMEYYYSLTTRWASVSIREFDCIIISKVDVQQENVAKRVSLSFFLLFSRR